MLYYRQLKKTSYGGREHEVQLIKHYEKSLDARKKIRFKHFCGPQKGLERSKGDHYERYRKAYATKLLENMNVHFNNLIAACPDNKKSVWVNLLDGINAIAAESYAGDIIDNLKIWDSDYSEYYTSFYYNVKSGRDSFSKNVMALLSKLA